MTPQLQALVEKLTCPHCLGNGATRWQYNTQMARPNGLVLNRDGNTVECLICEGSGINPEWDGDDF